MKNKAIRTLQKNGAEIITVIIAVIAIIVISIGIKEIVKASELEEANNESNEVVTTDENIESVPTSEEPTKTVTPIFSRRYAIKNNEISRIEIKTTIEEFIQEIEVGEGETVKVFKGSEEVRQGYVGTGMKLVVSDGQEKTISVRGDLTGEGEINQIELTKIIRHLVKLEGWELKGEKATSADITMDGKIDLLDITKIINYILYDEWEKSDYENEKEKYTVEHYTENLNGEYKLEETEHLEAVLGASVKAKIKEYKGFSKTTNKNEVLTGTISEDEKLVLKVYYARNEYDYTVKYYYNGQEDETAIKEVKAKYGTTITEYTPEEQEGYTVEVEGLPLTIGIEANEIRVCYTKNKYTITYKDDNGKTLGTEKVEYGEMPNPTEPTKESTIDKEYKFERWEPAIKEATENTTYIAKFTEATRKYTVTYLPGEKGTFDTQTKEADYGTATPEFSGEITGKAGYTFTGWTPKVAETIIGNVTYTANWEANKNTPYKVEHYKENLDGTYTLEEADTEELTGTTDTEAKVVVKTYEGFSKTTNENEVLKGTITADEILVLKVYYARNKYDYTVEYYYNGNKGETTTETAKYGAEITEYTSKVKDGYTLDKAEGLPLTIGTQANEIKVYYKLEDAYTITYDLNGGEVNGENPAEYTVESKNITLVNPTRAGYTFAGWTGSNGEEPQTEVTIAKGSTGVKTYTANWTANKNTAYKVEYYKENPDGIYTLRETENLTGTTDEEVTAVEKTYDGFIKTTNEDEVLTGTITADGKLVLKVYYKLVEYKIEYNLNGGTATNPGKYTVESENIILVNPTRTGYTFVGWTGSNGETAKLTVTIAKGSIGDKSYTANWKANTNTAYKVEHYKENLDGTYTLEETKELTGTTDEEATVVAKTYVGFSKTTNENEVLTGTITADGNLVLKVYYARNEYDYTVKYYYNSKEDETAKEEEKAKYGATITEYTSKEKEGYTLDSVQGSPLTIGTEANEIKVYYRLEEPYTINYNLDGGKVAGENPREYTVESEDITLVNPTKEGYTFEGWTGSNGEEPQTKVTIQKGTTGDKTYTANWTPNTNTPYKVEHYKENLDGTYALEETENLTGITDEEATAVTKTYVGFSKTTNENEVLKGTITADGKLVLKVYYKLVEYKIEYNLNGGTATNSDKYTVKTETFTLNNPARTGYTFAGWTGSNGEEPQTKVTIAKGSTGDKTYTANWIANTNTPYKVEHYKENLDGTYALAETDTENLTGTTDEEVTAVEKTYVGFSKTTNENEVLTGTITADGKLVLKVYYARNKYKVTFKNEDGTTVIKTEEVEYGKTPTCDNPTKEATAEYTYTFAGWEPAITTVTKDAEYKAKYTSTKNKYKVTFVNYNGDKLDETEVEYGANATYSKANPTREGYTFNGWDKELTNITENTTITAQWSVDTYTIFYALNDGTVSTENKTTYTVETETFTLNNPTRTGYTFVGWTGSNGVTAQQTVTIQKGTTGNKAYTANWEANTYTVVYNANGGTGSMANTTATYDANTTLADNTFTKSYKVSYDTAGGTTIAPTTVQQTFLGWTVGGKNLYEFSDIGKASVNDKNNTTINDDGTLTINLTSTDSTKYGNFFTKARNDITPNTNYVYIVDVKNKAVTGSVLFTYNCAFKNQTAQLKDVQDSLNNLNKGVNYTTISSNDSVSDTMCFVRGYVQVPAGASVNVTFRPIVIEGTYKDTPLYYTNKGTISNLATEGEVTLYADWAEKAINLPTPPTKTGYTFAGWYTAPTGGTKVEDGYIPGENITLYAHWTPNTYTVVYNANGGTGSMANTTATYDENTTLADNKFNKNYAVTYKDGETTISTTTVQQEFLGWTVGGKNLFEFSDIYNSSGTTINGDKGTLTVDLTNSTSGNNMYGHFFTRKSEDIKANTDYVCILDVKDKKNVTGAPFIQWNYDYSTQIGQIQNTLVNLSDLETGLNYKNTKSKTTLSNSTMLTRGYVHVVAGASVNVTFRPIIIEGTYTGTPLYYTNKGIINNLATEGEVTLYADWTEKAITLPTPTKEGYEFAGWYTAPTEGTKVEDGYIPGENTTLYARWTLKTPTISTISVANKDINLFDDTTTTFTANATDTAGDIKYQWYYNDTEITGATDKTYTISTSNMNSTNYNGGTYKVVATNAAGTGEKTVTQTVAKTINSATQMKNFATRVNEQGINFVNDTVELKNNIDLYDVCSADSSNWIPIGTNENNFNGTFDGKDNIVSKLYINTNSGFQRSFWNS